MKKNKLLFFILILPLFALAQKKEISGIVVDENKAPLAGASIVVKGTSTGAATDFDGIFVLSIPENSKTLIVSYTGFVTKEVSVSNLKNFTIQLKEDQNVLDEVIVVGYGTQRKSDITGAIASVKVEDAIARQSSTVDQLLTGRVAGVQVTQNGTPGSGISVRIRGNSSLTGNNEPLYVVDGIIIASAGEGLASADTGLGVQENQNGLNGINPRDIESMEVLKDASATAIYGSRGANGVVLITTKKGKSGKVKINAFTSTTISQLANKYDVLDGFGYARLQNDITGQEIYTTEGQDIYKNRYSDDGDFDGRELVDQVNWQEDGFRQGHSVEAQLTISGGNENGNFYLSGGAKSLQGIAENSGVESADVRLKLNQNLTNKLTLSASVTGFIADGQFSQDGSRNAGNKSYVGSLLRYRPLVEDGYLENIEDDALNLSSPYSWTNDFDDLSKEKRFIGNVSLKYELPVTGLDYKVQFGGNTRYKERRRFYGITTFPGKNANGKLSVSSANSNSYQLNNLLQYDKKINKNNRVNAVLGVAYDVRSSNNEIYEVSDFTTFAFRGDQPRYAQLVSRPLENIIQKTQLLSYLGRFNYTLKNRYIFTGSFRADGSSKFSKENRFGYFPSGSVAWRVSKEGFMKSIKNTLNEFKLRAGWGRIGNQGIKPYQTAANYGPVDYANSSDGINVGFAPLNIENPDLKWETTEQLNAGLDFGMFRNRITGSVDVYSKQTKDLLQYQTLGPSAGFRRLLVNRGELSNKGIELQLDGTLVNTDNFTLDIGGNIAFNKSKITYLGIPESSVFINGEVQQRSFYYGDVVSAGGAFKSPGNIFMEGEEIGLFFGWETDGIYQEGDDILPGFQPGDVRTVDQLTEDTNGDGIADAGNGTVGIEDRTIIGNPNPDFVYGLNLSMTYKRFNLNLLFNGVYGNEIANGNLYGISNTDGSNNNVLRAVYEDAWTVDNPSNTQPRIGYDKNNLAPAIDDRIIEDGSYFRLTNATLGYDLPISGVSLFISGTNLFTITDYSGFNPDISSFRSNGNILGVDWNGTPNVRTFSLGLNVKF